MDKRRSLCVLLFVLCIGTFFVYAYLLMLSEWSPIVLQLSVLMAVGGILAMIAWIGYVVATKQPTSATITSSDDSPI